MARNTWSDGENTKYMAAYEEAMKQGLDQREKFEYSKTFKMSIFAVFLY
jgi:hypothetical protein